MIVDYQAATDEKGKPVILYSLYDPETKTCWPKTYKTHGVQPHISDKEAPGDFWALEPKPGQNMNPGSITVRESKEHPGCFWCLRVGIFGLADYSLWPSQYDAERDARQRIKRWEAQCADANAES